MVPRPAGTWAAQLFGNPKGPSSSDARRAHSVSTAKEGAGLEGTSGEERAWHTVAGRAPCGVSGQRNPTGSLAAIAAGPPQHAPTSSNSGSSNSSSSNALMAQAHRSSVDRSTGKVRCRACGQVRHPPYTRCILTT